MPKTYELEDWEYALVIRLRKLRRERFEGQVHLDVGRLAIVGKLDTHVEQLPLPGAPPLLTGGARV